ncbi:hypothetical protein KSF78_0001728, partial [Schistosoma japonicum]
IIALVSGGDSLENTHAIIVQKDKGHILQTWLRCNTMKEITISGKTALFIPFSCQSSLIFLYYNEFLATYKKAGIVMTALEGVVVIITV